MDTPVNALDIGLSPARQLHKGWISFVSRYEWQWFCTMTFRDSVHPESADKRFRMFVSKLNRKLFGPRWSSKKHTTVYWARGLEYQKRGVLHFHALLACAGKDLNHIAIRRDWEAVWQDLSGYARIEKVRSQKDASRYVTKYVTKGGQIDLSPNLLEGGMPAQADGLGTDLAASVTHLA